MTVNGISSNVAQSMTGFFRRTMVGGLITATAVRVARGAEWPERPVTWVVPFPPGSSSDTYARPVAALVSNELGQPIIIDNRSGAGGTLAATLLTRAVADGYTLMVGYTGLAYSSIIYPKSGAGFDLGQDFVPISAIAREPLVLAINPARLDIATLRQFIALANVKPESIDVASDGLGTVSHLAINLLEERTGIKLKHVPHLSGVQKLQGLLSGRVGAIFDSPGAVAGQAKAGKIRLLAVAGRRRDALLPDVPTFAEAGLPDFLVSQWFGLFAPKRTPDPILDRMHGAVQAALSDEQIRRIWAEHGARVESESRADFTRFVAQEIIRWKRIAKAASLTLE
jgi:tripartite-type tricarboxylate transporter receptor subunit TctC